MEKRRLFAMLLLSALALGVWYLRADSLCEETGVRGEDYTVEVTLIEPIPQKEADGSITYTHEIVSFTAEAGSEEAEDLLQVMDGIPCRSRWRLPFEKTMVYMTGKESVELHFRMEGRIVDLSMLSGTRTIYDLGSRSRQYSVSGTAFEELAACAKRNGEARAE